ncbi:MAG: BTAD domain-containing putative transcriptional regulator [Acidobacteriota bacterium]
MKAPVLPAPPPYFGRLLRLIRSSDQPLVQLVTWPSSGARAFLAALRLKSRDAPPLPPSGTEDDLQVWVDEGGAERHDPPPDDATDEVPPALGSVLGSLRPSQRVIVVTNRLTTPPAHRVTVIRPTTLLLTRTEVATLLGDAGHRGIDADVVTRLHDLTDGWYGPLRWLAARPAHRLGGEEAVEELVALVDERIVSALDRNVLEVLLEVSLTEPLDLRRARGALADDPAALASLERVMRYWCVPTGNESAPLRLPTLLRRALTGRRATQWRPERWESTVRRWLAVDRGVGETPVTTPELTDDERREPVLRVQEVEVRFELVLFGHPRVDRVLGDRPAVEIQWRIRRSLFVVAFLALADDHRASRDDLITAVWPDAAGEAIRKNFHPTLSDARRALDGKLPGVPNPIVFHDGLYRLNPAIGWRIDVDRFSRREANAREWLERGHKARALGGLRGAWRLYRGPLLAEDEQPWIVTQRRELHRRYLDVLRGIGDLFVDLDRPHDALDAFRAILVEDPFDEHVHLAVMRLYAERGRRDLIRRQYVRLQGLLDELGVAPLEETQEAYHALMRETMHRVE